MLAERFHPSHNIIEMEPRLDCPILVCTDCGWTDKGVGRSMLEASCVPFHGERTLATFVERAMQRRRARRSAIKDFLKGVALGVAISGSAIAVGLVWRMVT